MNNISDALFEAIQKIVDQTIADTVSWDKTITCKVVSRDTEDEHKYYVTDGSLRFEAYTSDDNKTRYIKDTQVYVLIPSGDMNKRKIITGSYSTDKIPKNMYANPFQDFMKAKTYTFNKNDGIVDTDENGNQIYILTHNFEKTPYIVNYDYMGFEFGVKCAEISDYAFVLELINKTGSVEEYVITHKDLYGNPYNQTGEIKFQFLYPFPEMTMAGTGITGIKITTVIVEGQAELFEPTMYFGYQKDNVSSNNLKLILEDTQSLQYSAKDEDEATQVSRNLYIDWQYNKPKDQQYFFDFSNPPSIDNFITEIGLFNYQLGYEKDKQSDIEIQAGTFWKKIVDLTDFQYTLNNFRSVKTDRYKIGIRYNEYDIDSNQLVERFKFSNVLIFENTAKADKQGAIGPTDTLRLELGENDTGIYNYYGLDGTVIETNLINQTHTVIANFIDGTELEEGEEDLVTWIFPQNNTMIVSTKTIREEKDGETIKSLDRGIANKQPYATFKLASRYGSSLMNNTIRCEVRKGNDILHGSITLQFGEASTSGTNYRLNLDFEDDTEIRGTTAKIKTSFERTDGQRVETIPNIEYKWKDNLNSGFGDAGTEITCPTVPFAENFAILQAYTNYTVDTGKPVNLNAYLPMTMADKEYDYITGPTRIVYDAFGNISKSDKPLGLYKFNSDVPEENVIWRLTSSKTYTNDSGEIEYYSSEIGNDMKIISYPIVENNKLKTTYINLDFPQFQIKNDEITILPPSKLTAAADHVNLSAWVDGSCVWSQPLLIIQDSWRYELVNAWDGSFKINDKDGSILSSLLVAGSKNQDNQFTGVIMGDIGVAGQGDADGLYGFQNGENRFRLTENGEFFVGGKNTNQYIHLDESGNLKIEIGELDLTATKININANGLKIDSEQGLFELEDKILFDSKSGTATLGGWIINSNEIATGSVHGGGTGIIISTDHGILARKSTGEGIEDYIDTFHITKDGNATFAGTLNAATGTFTGELNVNNKFKVDTAGNVSAAGTIDIKGTGSIAGWKINSSGLTKGSTTLGADTEGTISTENLKADGGVIGDWGIGTTILTGFTKSVTGLYSNGQNASVALTPDGLYASFRDDLGGSTTDYRSWADIMRAIAKILA